MHLDEIAANLADVRAALSRHYQLDGVEADRAELAETIAAVAVAEQRLHSMLDRLAHAG